MRTVLALYITLMPIILAGVLNMIFCKSSLLQAAYRPMDGGLVLKDGKRLFGANKTWKGFIGMIVWGSLAQILWGVLLKSTPNQLRSEERRVGKECRSRWSPYH